MGKNINYNYFNWGPFLFKSKIDEEFKQLILKEGASVRGQESESYNSKLAGHLNEAPCSTDHGTLKVFLRSVLYWLQSMERRR